MITVEVDSWTVNEFLTASTNGSLDTSPEYQRRAVWRENDRIFLIDSVARRLPIGAITLFADNSKGYDKYEVLDGKQRLTSILAYLRNEFPMKRSVITKLTSEDDDETDDNASFAEAFYDKQFEDLDHPAKMTVLQYRIPVFVVKGDRKDAVFAFYRMNRTSYTLKPQEIRHAVFYGTYFLDAVTRLEESLTSDLADGQHILPFIGVVSRQNLERMQDIQLLSELLVLLLNGPQHRRDSLDYHYDLYRDPAATSGAEVTSKVERLRQIITQLFQIFESTSLQSWHFPSNCENDYYGLVGALDKRGLLTKPQMDELRAELALVISEFRREVERFVAVARDRRQVDPNEFAAAVEEYGRGFLGGQINSKPRREDRIRIWEQVINEVVATLDPQSAFSEMQRRAIWARSSEKLCARCGELVEWKDYHAGHREPHAKGGRTVVENGQIEHAWCNQAAGAA